MKILSVFVRPFVFDLNLKERLSPSFTLARTPLTIFFCCNWHQSVGVTPFLRAKAATAFSAS